MTQHNQENRHSDLTLSTGNSSRRDFIKLCGAAGVGGVSSLLLPQDTEAAVSLDLIKSRASEGIFDELFWSIVRSQFVFQPGTIYMNTGTEGIMPRYVTARMGNYFKKFAENPWDAMMNSPVQTACDTVAEFIGADPDEIVITTNTTEGMCLTVNGLDLQEPDEVLTTVHFKPFNSCLSIVRDRRNVTITELGIQTPAQNNDEIIATFENAITPQTKVFCFCHINYSTGLRMPVKELCQLARDNDIITIVDGAHAIGMFNLDLHDLGCDFYACSPHKWLNAPPGTGVLYMRKEVQDLLWPTVTEGYPSIKQCSSLFQTKGQVCYPIYSGLIDALNFQNLITKDKVENRIMALSTYLKEEIVNTWGEGSLFTPLDEEMSSGLVCFNPFDDHSEKGGRLTALWETLYEMKVVTRTAAFRDAPAQKDRRALRISTHIFNSFSQLDSVLTKIKSIIAEL